jgi:hypothetical protein
MTANEFNEQLLQWVRFRNHGWGLLQIANLDADLQTACAIFIQLWHYRKSLSWLQVALLCYLFRTLIQPKGFSYHLLADSAFGC